MPTFNNSDELYGRLRRLFTKIKEQDPRATDGLVQARMLIRFDLKDPAAIVLIDGRRAPVQVHYGPAPLRPDLDVAMSAEALHLILLKELSMRKAIAEGQVKVRGAVWKVMPLEQLFRRSQALYPGLLDPTGGGNGHQPV